MFFSLTSSPSLMGPVHQGGVLSPILFTILFYIDDLLADLEKQVVGCFWRHHFAGVACYADDIALIMPSVGSGRLC